MLNSIKSLFTVLILVLSSCAAHGDPAAVAFAAYTGIENGGKPASSLILNSNTYEIQQHSSKMLFRVDSPIGDVWACFQDFEGVFTMLNNVIDNDLASIEINAESLNTRGGFIGALLKSESFFDVENFPSMHFVGSSLEWYSETRAVLKGEMTIKGITRQVAFYIELVDADVDGRFSERITVKATTTIRRSEFGISSLLPAVSDNVNLFMSIDAVKKTHLYRCVDAQPQSAMPWPRRRIGGWSRSCALILQI